MLLKTDLPIKSWSLVFVKWAVVKGSKENVVLALAMHYIRPSRVIYKIVNSCTLNKNSAKFNLIIFFIATAHENS